MKDSLPQELVVCIEDTLRSLNGSASSVTKYKRLSGGSVNEALKLESNKGNYFLKWNTRKNFPEMFRQEAKGLTLLQKTKALPTPKVISTGETDLYQFLLLEMIESNGPASDYAQNLGIGLAQLHKTNSETAGLDENNYIGSLPQANQRHKSWIDFYIHERLQYQLLFAESAGLADARLRSDFEKLFMRLPKFITEETHSLLHGDLWNGNVIMNKDGQAVIIDPAVYFGHREMDIAMARLFGGFEPQFYSAYKEAFPMEQGSDERTGLYQLYPLLVHLNLFGKTYLPQIRNVISRYL